MDIRPVLKLLVAAAAVAALPSCDWMKKKDPPGQKSEKELAAEKAEGLRKACASEATYSRLKELVFDEAARIRNADARNLDPLAANAVVRMEKPLVKSRDDELNVTVCTGRFILELPPGAENAFDGMRRLAADVEYAAQAAADGSGLVYQMDGAEPIVYRLATFGLAPGEMPRLAQAEPPAPEPQIMPAPEPQPATPEPKAAPEPKSAPPRPEPAPKREAQSQPGRTAASPSFNCRYARTSTEKMVCASPALAAKDREMASIYYAAMAGADGPTRAHLRRSRDSFLARRERCGTASCVTAAYNSRIAEIRSISAGR